VPHVQQAFTWDCGLACVLMVLRTLGLDCCHGIAELEKLCRTTSVWTVDLAYLLHKFSVNFSFFTVTIGANPQYSAETFYRVGIATCCCSNSSDIRCTNVFKITNCDRSNCKKTLIE
uniref:Guanylyl cyclase n=1 Tax=Aegilops tauschii subsp. strangulata TaxID=200361 RepID=A0A452Z8I3_AEGTS